MEKARRRQIREGCKYGNTCITIINDGVTRATWSKLCSYLGDARKQTDKALSVKCISIHIVHILHIIKSAKVLNASHYGSIHGVGNNLYKTHTNIGDTCKQEII